ncbi:MAG: polyribonucleotide nucleotidyltransferase [Candidatus Omnitrophica bacterium]|nr:polyribonucleotide nucleotidyltransferase [Candidatus Omnitrophota bacterium]
MSISRMEIPFGGKTIIVETGKVAKQATSSVVLTCGGTTVLVAVCMAKKPSAGSDFFPLAVEYQEKAYAAGKIPGGFFKREGRPTQKEILSSRLVDRPIRPLFPEGFLNEVIISCNVLSSDGENDPDVLAVLGTSFALHISEVPFDGPIGVARVCKVDGQMIVNPVYAERENCTFELFVASMEKGIVMIEGEAKEVPEAEIVDGLRFAHEQMKVLLDAQNDFRKKCGKEKAKVELFKPHADLKKKVHDLAFGKIQKAYTIADKIEREHAIIDVADEVLKNMEDFQEFKVNDRDVTEGQVKMILDSVEYDVVREAVFEKQKRADGRSLKDVREISGEIGVLPRTHGSALFTRGQTQSLAVTTLGTKRDEQMIEGLQGVDYNDFMLHYNFPPFSVGEAKMSRGPGRREIGHGALAAKSIKGILPSKEEFPYTIRIVSEILESNGSSSMASVCAGCLSLMDAGVPIKSPVAGISIGLIMGDKDDKYALLTDIMGLEDHFGDMDFKVAGTTSGVTAIQLDLKIQGVSVELLADAVAQSREARIFILDKMSKVISKPKTDISEFAPRIIVTSVPQDKIGEVIGPGGKTIKRIIEETGIETIDIDDDGTVHIVSMSKEGGDKALAFINGMTELPEVGKIYDARVMKVANFGAFCEFMPGKQGLVHVSEFSKTFVKDIESLVKVGDTFKVKLVEIDKMNRMNLSKKQAEE